MDARHWLRWMVVLAISGALLLGGVTIVVAQKPVQPPPPGPGYAKEGPTPQLPILPPPNATSSASVPPQLPPATTGPKDKPLPINLPTALRLANAQALDIIIATQQLRIATAQLQGAKVLWLPSLYAGADYEYHSGPLQNANGTVSQSSRSSLFAGASPYAVFAVTDAIFTPLAQRQVTRAQQANVQTATNDTLTQVALVYFDALEARADLASLEDIGRRVEEVVRKTELLVPGGLVPDVELDRVRAVRSNVKQLLQTARQRWRVASAEVARVLRLEPTTLIEPLESPQVQIKLVSPDRSPEELIPIATQFRPELTFNEAQVAAAEERLRQEKWRPFLPMILVRGDSSPTPYPLAGGVYLAGPGGGLSDPNMRSDWDLQALWEVRNLGFGNRAIIREREGNLALARSQEFRFQDLVAREVTQTWAELQSAEQRIVDSELELHQALLSANKNYAAYGETKRVGGNINILVIRPLEVVAALQALTQAYFDYYGAIADYNRSQFRMYRAMGNPAQLLQGHDGVCGPSLPAPAPADPPMK